MHSLCSGVSSCTTSQHHVYMQSLIRLQARLMYGRQKSMFLLKTKCGDSREPCTDCAQHHESDNSTSRTNFRHKVSEYLNRMVMSTFAKHLQYHYPCMRGWLGGIWRSNSQSRSKSTIRSYRPHQANKTLKQRRSQKHISGKNT